MQPQTSKGKLKDYFSSQKIIGKQYPQKIYNFKGDELFNTSQIHPEHKSLGIKSLNNQQISNNYFSLYVGNKKFSVNLSDDLKFWVLALPIVYGSTVEGILVTHIPAMEMSKALDLNNILDLMNCRLIIAKLLINNQIL